jgi:hypothetical protein
LGFGQNLPFFRQIDLVGRFEITVITLRVVASFLRFEEKGLGFCPFEFLMK